MQITTNLCDQYMQITTNLWSTIGTEYFAKETRDVFGKSTVNVKILIEFFYSNQLSHHFSKVSIKKLCLIKKKKQIKLSFGLKIDVKCVCSNAKLR